MKKDDPKWWLVETKIDQIKKATANARRPLFLALIWSFLTLVSVYNHYWGYSNTLARRFEAALMSQDPCSDELTFKRYHCDPNDEKTVQLCHIVPGNSYPTEGTSKQTGAEWCREILKKQHEELLKQQVDFWKISIPGFGAPLTAYDLGVMGQLAIVLIFLWLFYATRRELHAMEGLVRVARNEPSWFRRLVADLRRSVFLDGNLRLDRAEKDIGTSYLGHAYHAISQEFVFITSRPRWYLLAATFVLLLLPSITSAVIAISDIGDLVHYFGMAVSSGSQGVSEYFVRSGISVCSSLIAILLGSLVVRNEIGAAVLLNAWAIAAEATKNTLDDNREETLAINEVEVIVYPWTNISQRTHQYKIENPEDRRSAQKVGWKPLWLVSLLGITLAVSDLYAFACLQIQYSEYSVIRRLACAVAHFAVFFLVMLVPVCISRIDLKANRVANNLVPLFGALCGVLICVIPFYLYKMTDRHAFPHANEVVGHILIWVLYGVFGAVFGGVFGHLATYRDSK